ADFERLRCLYFWQMIRVLALAVFIGCLQVKGYAKEPLETTVCAIAAHPSTFHNKIVRIRAEALSGMEAATLMDGQDGKLDTKCGRINLNFDSVEHDNTTDQFLKLFGTDRTFPQCDREKELNQGMAHILDPRAPAPKPCFDTLCMHCPRYN